MQKAVIIDDERLARNELKKLLLEFPEIEVVGEAANAAEGLEKIENLSPDLIFLDIQMPGLTGLQFIQSMTEKPMIILITAYEKYALEGFNLDVTDYLVKPVSLDRFVKACNKAKELYELKNRTNKDAPSNPDYFFVNVDYSLLKVNFSDIRYIEGLKDYIKIHLKSSSRAIITRMAMKAIEEELPVAKFLRIHKSYIISLEHITAIRKNSVFIDEIELPVGENFRAAVGNLTGRQD